MSTSIQVPDADAPPPEADLRARLHLALERAVDGVLDKSNAVALHAGGGPLRLFEQRPITGHWPGKFAEGASVLPPDDVLAAAAKLYGLAMEGNTMALMGAVVSTTSPRYDDLLVRYRIALLIALSAGIRPPEAERKKTRSTGLQLVQKEPPPPPRTRKKRDPDKLTTPEQAKACGKKRLKKATDEELRALRPRVAPRLQVRIDAALAGRAQPSTRKDELPRHTYPQSRYVGHSD